MNIDKLSELLLAQFNFDSADNIGEKYVTVRITFKKVDYNYQIKDFKLLANNKELKCY